MSGKGHTDEQVLVHGRIGAPAHKDMKKDADNFNVSGPLGGCDSAASLAGNKKWKCIALIFEQLLG